MDSKRFAAPAILAALLLLSLDANAQFQMERLSRGVIAVRTSSSQVYVGWRLFGTEPMMTAPFRDPLSLDDLMGRKQGRADGPDLARADEIR